MKFIDVLIIILSIYKSCDWIYFFHGMVFEIVLNNEIQIFLFSNWFIFLRGKNMFVYIIGKTLILSFEQNRNKISKFKNNVLCNVWNQRG